MRPEHGNINEATEAAFERLFGPVPAHVGKVVRSGVEPDVGVREFLDKCEEVAPNPGWGLLRRLDVAKDLTHLARWLRRVFRVEPPAAEIVGLYFGLFDDYTVTDKTLVAFEIYVSGSTRFDLSDPALEWAAEKQYTPEGCDSGSKVLHEMGRIAGAHRLPSTLSSYALPLVYGCLAVDYLARHMPDVLLGSAKSRGIAVGWDCGGDALVLGTIDSQGYHRSTDKWP